MHSLEPVAFHGDEPPVLLPGFTPTLGNNSNNNLDSTTDALTPAHATGPPPGSEPPAPAITHASTTPLTLVIPARHPKPPSSKTSKKAARKARKAARDAVNAGPELKTTTDQDEDFPFPGKIGCDGKHEVGYLPPLELMKRPALEAWCREFRLGIGGRKAELIERLRDFSADRAAWDSLLPGAQNNHKGPRASTKVITKKSTNRRNALLGLLVPSEGKAAVTHQLPTERSKDIRTLEEIEYSIAWAENVARMFPYHPPTENEPISLPLPPPPPPATEKNDVEMTQLREQLQQTQLQLINALTRLSCGPSPSMLPPPPTAPPLALESVPATVPQVAELAMPLQTASASLSEPSRPRAHAPSPSTHMFDNAARKLTRNIKELVLGNGIKISFSPEDVPALPALSFVNTLGRLNNIWDDTSKYWNKDNPDTPLIIKGQPIALIYWPAVFTYSKNKKWEVIKKQFVDWREFVIRFRRGTPEEFWAEFSRDGKYFPWTKITEILREERKAEYDATAKRAREQYGSSFDSIFSYSKKGKTVVMTRPYKIHEHYLKLHPRDNDS